jgi:hypothetical protein
MRSVLLVGLKAAHTAAYLHLRNLQRDRGA